MKATTFLRSFVVCVPWAESLRLVFQCPGQIYKAAELVSLSVKIGSLVIRLRLSRFWLFTESSRELNSKLPSTLFNVRLSGR
jgi:hypothetical protein